MEVDDNSKEEKVLVNSAIGSTRERSRPPTAEKTHLDLERLFREHSALVFRSAYRVTGRTDDAEDVLQTVFLRLARQGSSLDLLPTPRAYLHRAAINAALDVVRVRKRKPSIPLEEIELPGMQLTASDQESRLEIRRVIQSAISSLNGRAAEIFTLKYLEGYENAEIAEMLGISPLVLPVLLHRARARVRNEIRVHLGGKS
jgi:RNA polymerase sigma-70 factor (ECF subfamily)